MKADVDQRIDAVLRSLSTAEPGTAMQTRLLRTLQEADAAAFQSKQLRQRKALVAGFERVTARPALALAACFVLGLAVVPLLTRQTKRAIPSHGDVAASRPDTVFNSSDLAGTSQLPAAATLASKRPDTRLHASGRITAPPAKTPLRVDGVAASVNGFPSLPLPLTEQEQLLRRLVRHQQPGQIAQLTMPSAESIAARERDAVTEFFAPLPPLRGQQEPAGYDPPVGLQ